jgi:hypothetical protein
MKKEKINNSVKGIGGWLLIVLLDLFISGLSTFILFIQKIILILTGQAKLGVYLSAFLLLIYCIFISITIFMILNKRKLAIKTFFITAIIGTVFLIWYYLLSSLIYHQFTPEQMFSNWIIVIVNIALTVLIAFYFMKSKRAKNTLLK